jgi:hypothetical protein
VTPRCELSAARSLTFVGAGHESTGSLLRSFAVAYVAVFVCCTVLRLAAMRDDREPRIKSLSGASSAQFMGVRAAGQTVCAYSDELGPYRGELQPELQPAAVDSQPLPLRVAAVDVHQMVVHLMGITADDLKRTQAAELRMVNLDISRCHSSGRVHASAADRNTISPTAGESC